MYNFSNNRISTTTADGTSIICSDCGNTIHQVSEYKQAYKCCNCGTTTILNKPFECVHISRNFLYPTKLCIRLNKRHYECAVAAQDVQLADNYVGNAVICTTTDFTALYHTIRKFNNLNRRDIDFMDFFHVLSIKHPELVQV